MARRNLVRNPSFETDAALWTASNNNAALRRVASGIGVSSYLVDTRAVAAGDVSIYQATSTNPVTPGQSYIGSIYVYQGSGVTKSVRLDIDWYSSDNRVGYISTASSTFSVANNTLVRISKSGAAPAGANYAVIYVAFLACPVNGYVAVDGAMFEPGTTLSVYADGDSPTWEWDGTPHASTSSESYAPDSGERVNLCKNPSAEVSAAEHYVSFEGGGADAQDLLRFSSSGFSGTSYFYCYVRDTDGGGDAAIYIRQPEFTVAAGQQYTCSAYVRYNGTATSVRLGIDWLRSDGSVVSGVTGTAISPPGSYGRITASASAPAGAVRARSYVLLAGISNSALELFAYDAVLYEKSSSLGSYFDGDTTSASWTGTPHLSRSVLLVTVPASVTFSPTASLTAQAKVPPQARVSFVPASQLLAAPRRVHQGRFTAAPLVSLLPSAQRVWTTPALTVSARAELGQFLQRVWHTPSTTYGVETGGEWNLSVAPPPQGLTIVSRRQLYVPAARRGRRYIAQDILTGEFLHWELPIIDDEITYVLSGSKTISGQLNPEHPDIAELVRSGVLRSRKTWIHAEEDDQIIGSGILQPGSVDAFSLNIDAAGFTSYAHGITWRGAYEGIAVDPADLIRKLWGHVQSFPGSDLGVLVDPTTTPVRLGTPPRDVEFETGEGEQVSFVAGPYKLNWWENTDCGQEIEKLAKEASIDFLERDYWNADKTDVLHRVVLGHPRVGNDLRDLKFAQDENIVEAVPIREDSDLGATQVYVTGSGEGRDMVWGTYIGPLNGGLRVPVVISDKTITRTERASAFAEDEYMRQQATFGVEQIVIDTDHENAVLGTFSEGDDILIRATIPWHGPVAIRHRILSYTLKGNGRADLKLRPSSAFRYGTGA